jgi:hypothetical protein
VATAESIVFLLVCVSIRNWNEQFLAGGLLDGPEVGQRGLKWKAFCIVLSSTREIEAYQDQLVFLPSLFCTVRGIRGLREVGLVSLGVGSLSAYTLELHVSSVLYQLQLSCGAERPGSCV